MSRSRIPGWGHLLVLVALVVTACSPAVPDLPNLSGDAAAVVSTSPPTFGSGPTETTAVHPSPVGSSAAPAVATPATTTPATAPPATTLADSPQQVSVGSWTLTGTTQDESGSGYAANVAVPTLRADVAAALLGRIANRIDGQVESQIGSTLALWRSIEAQGSRDISGSTLRLDFDVAGFEEDFISLRFFSEASVGGSGSVERRATTLMIDLASGAAIGLDDIIVDGAESRAALFSLVRSRLLVEYFDGDTEAYSLWAGDLRTRDLDQVALTPIGLEVWFDELEVGPPEIGMPVVTLTYADLGGIIDPAGPTAVFSR